MLARGAFGSTRKHQPSELQESLSNAPCWRMRKVTAPFASASLWAQPGLALHIEVSAPRLLLRASVRQTRSVNARARAARASVAKRANMTNLLLRDVAGLGF